MSIVIAWLCSSQDKYVCYKGTAGTFSAVPRGGVLACKQYVPGILKSNIASSPPNYGVVWNLKWRDDIPLSSISPVWTHHSQPLPSIESYAYVLFPLRISPSFWSSMVDVRGYFLYSIFSASYHPYILGILILILQNKCRNCVRVKNNTNFWTNYWNRRETGYNM